MELRDAYHVIHVMKTFSRRAKRAAQEALIETTDHQPNSEPSPYDELFLSEDQQEAVLESLSAKPSLRQPSPNAKLAPSRPLKPEPASKKPPGPTSGGSRGRPASQQGSKLDQKPAGGKSSGRSIGSGLRVGASKPEKPAASKGSGRLLGGYKSSKAAASPSPKRKASSSQLAPQVWACVGATTGGLGSSGYYSRANRLCSCLSSVKALQFC